MAVQVIIAYNTKEYQEISTTLCSFCGESTPTLKLRCAECSRCRICGRHRDGTPENNTRHHYLYDIGKYVD